MKLNWTCPDCRRSFDKLPTDYSIDAPGSWLALPAGERHRRGKLTDDFCSIDGKDHFIRGCIDLKVHDCPETFVWGVWVSVSERTLRRFSWLFSQPKFKREPRHTGILETWIGAYPKPVDLRCELQLRPGDARPLVILDSPDYPLAIEQREGITLDRVKQIASLLGHA